MKHKTTIRKAIAALLVLVVSAVQAQDSPARPTLALMGTIPLYWGESESIGDLIGGTAERHWARERLEQRFELSPLSYLDADGLAAYDALLLAQPRALSGEENVALDAWVRAGGRLLLFADPMMTGHSRFSLGDRRRPQDVIMLSPILRHWGLELEFDEHQTFEATTEEAEGLLLPVALPGRFRVIDSEDTCTLSATRVLARCRIGEGEAVILADAGLLDGESPEAGFAAFDRLVALAFP